MALPNWKITYFFSFAERGWTESWFSQNSVVDPRTMLSEAREVGDLRANLLCDGAKIKAIRISRPNTTPDGFLEYVNLTNQVLLAPGASTFLGILGRFYTSSVYESKSVFLRGFPDDVEVNGGQFNGLGASVFTLGFNQWGNSILSKNWGWYGKLARFRQTDVTATEGADQTVTFAGTQPVYTDFPAPTIVTVDVSSFPKRLNINGQHIVQVINPTTARTVKPLGIGATTLKGKLQVASKDFRQASLFRVLKVSPRKAGAPLLLTPGRRSAR
jgi:hypothetical protein